MNRKLMAAGLVALLCLAEALLAQDTPMDTTSGSASKITYTLKTVNYPHDPYTQLLGINNAGEIVGYHGAGERENPPRASPSNCPTPSHSKTFRERCRPRSPVSTTLARPQVSILIQPESNMVS